MIKRLVFLPFLVFLIECGSVATVRPLEPDERALAFSIGGPVATLPGIADVPLPYSVLRYRWGIIDDLEAHVGLHPTMLAFGTIGMDFGLSYEFLRQQKWLPSLCFGLNPTLWLNPFNQDGVGAAPGADLIASWYAAPRLLLYTGGQAFFQLDEPYVPWAALVGTEWRIGKMIGLSLEAKWYAPFQDSEFRIVNFPISPGNRGALGIVAGFSLYPGGVDE